MPNFFRLKKGLALGPSRTELDWVQLASFMRRVKFGREGGLPLVYRQIRATVCADKRQMSRFEKTGSHCRSDQSLKDSHLLSIIVNLWLLSFQRLFQHDAWAALKNP